MFNKPHYEINQTKTTTTTTEKPQKISHTCCCKNDTKKVDDITTLKEYPRFMKEFLKITGNDDIFMDFTDKIEHQGHINEDTKKNVLALNTLVQGIDDIRFREYIYHKIIDELILYCFGSQK